MTDSRVEELLQQMSLKEPPATLDARVKSVIASCLTSVPETSDRWTWPIWSAIAAACLVVGVIIGRTSAPLTPLAVADSQLRETPDNPKTQFVSSEANAGPSTEEGGATPPRLAMVCSVPDKRIDRSETAGCLKCHDESAGASPTDNAQLPMPADDFHRQLCVKCHQTSSQLQGDLHLEDLHHVPHPSAAEFALPTLNDQQTEG